MDAKAFLDALLTSLQAPAKVAVELKSRTTTEQKVIRAELMRLLHSSAAPLDTRAAALILLRQLGVDLLAELKSLGPDAAADIATEAVLLQDESGTLLDVLTRANLGEDES